MKLLLSEHTAKDEPKGWSLEERDCYRHGYAFGHEDGCQSQLKHIFNLDAKTTSEVIVKLKAHLDKLFLKEMAK